MKCGWRLRVLLAGLALVSGCARETPFDTLALGAHESAIRNGEAAPDQAFGAVVALAVVIKDKRIPYCSGTLVEHDLVVTAAHCVTSNDAFPFETYLEEGLIRVLTGENAVSEPADAFQIVDYRVPKGFVASQQGEDIALLRLDREAAVTPFARLDAANALKAGDSVTFVGYGKNENDEEGVRLQASGIVRAVCPADSPGACLIDLSSGAEAFMPPASLLFETEKSGPCTGDSGGAVFVDLLGQKFLAGVVSFGDENCSQYSVSTHVADYGDWMNAAFEAPDADNCSASPKRNDTGCVLPFVVLAGVACLRLKRFRRKKGGAYRGLTR